VPRKARNPFSILQVGLIFVYKLIVGYVPCDVKFNAVIHKPCSMGPRCSNWQICIMDNSILSFKIGECCCCWWWCALWAAIDSKSVEVEEQISQHICNNREATLMKLHVKWASFKKRSGARTEVLPKTFIVMEHRKMCSSDEMHWKAGQLRNKIRYFSAV
jgi:hypothetical protein